MNSNEIVIYETPSKEIKIDVRLEKDTVWLTQAQISALFDTERSVITKHINNIFKSKELEETGNVQKMHITGTDKPTKIYTLDIIIAVGYRINSAKATKFRIWATQILRDFLLKGYAINEQQILETQNKFKELQAAINFMQEKSKTKRLTGKETEILNLLASYAKTLTLLQAYDTGTIPTTKGSQVIFTLTYELCIQIIIEIKQELLSKNEAGDLFGNERAEGLEGIIGSLYQTYGGEELYTTIEDKTANLLYLIIKDHPFSDGNKRIASFLFVYFLEKNQRLYRESGEKRINDNALTALALLVAESDPKEKDLLVNIIKSLLID